MDEIENSIRIGWSHLRSYTAQMAFRLTTFATKSWHKIKVKFGETLHDNIYPVSR